MSERIMQAGLVHKHMQLSTEDFFAAIDASGGWPLGYKFVGFEHTDERAAGFTNSPANTGWWTVIADVDDYYLWKLSPEALQRVADAVRSAMSIPYVNASALRVKNSRGYLSAKKEAHQS